MSFPQSVTVNAGNCGELTADHFWSKEMAPQVMIL